MEEFFMRQALGLAKKAVGLTSPNPLVGAVIVKGGRIVAQGWHKKAGDDHAEIVAIKEMMRKSNIVTRDIEPALFQNATLYVTLEPCSHNGRTPPCAKAILAAGFKKVCIGMRDPFLKVNGRGIKYLKDHGVEVKVCKNGSALSKEIRALNQPFIKWAMVGLPYVILKGGMSIDGKIATSAGNSKWITSEKSRDDARLLRSRFDVVLVGQGTVRADDPELGAHRRYKSKKLLRVIVDSRLSLNLKSKVFRDENVFVACSDLASNKNKIAFKEAEIQFRSFGKEKISVKKLLKYLGSIGVQSVFVEGGSNINGAFFDGALRDSQLLDRVVFYLAPKILGGKNALPVIGGEGVLCISNAPKFLDLKMDLLGEDVKFDGILNFY